MPVWLAITLAIATPIFSVGATLLTMAFTTGGRFSRIETTQDAHTKALETLPDVLRGFVTTDTGKGYKEQLDRHEKSHAECDGKLSSMRQEIDGRFERALAKVAAGEQAQAVHNSGVSAALAEFRATMAGMREAIDRLAEDRHHAPAAAPPSQIAQLREAVELFRIVKGLGAPA